MLIVSTALPESVSESESETETATATETETETARTCCRVPLERLGRLARLEKVPAPLRLGEPARQ